MKTSKVRRLVSQWFPPRPAEAGRRLVDLSDAWGKKDQAEAWLKILKSNTSARP
jgi:hypothetical protein